MKYPLYDESVTIVPLDHKMFHLFWSNKALKEVEVDKLIAVCFNSINIGEIYELILKLWKERVLNKTKNHYKNPQANEYLMNIIKSFSVESVM
jgi:hypothetical protein